MSSRLFQKIREKRGLVYSIYSSLNVYRDAGTMLVYAGMAPGKAQAVVDLTIKELRDLRQKLVSSDELKRAKESMKGAVVLSLESSSSRMTNLAQQLLYFGEFISMQEVLDGFDTVNARDVRRLANEMFDSSYLTLTALGGENSPGLESVSLKV